MEMTEIRRERHRVIEAGSCDESLASVAEDVLGYKAKRAEIDFENSNHMPRLLTVLAKLEIEVLNPRDVERYKLEKRQEIERLRLQDNPDREPVLFWQERKISEYRKPIPDFVLNKAIQIKREVPECVIEIVELDETPDPFLLVSIGYSERYYIEVWDEPKFER